MLKYKFKEAYIFCNQKIIIIINPGHPLQTHLFTVSKNSGLHSCPDLISFLSLTYHC